MTENFVIIFLELQNKEEFGIRECFVCGHFGCLRGGGGLRHLHLHLHLHLQPVPH